MPDFHVLFLWWSNQTIVNYTSSLDQETQVLSTDDSRGIFVNNSDDPKTVLQELNEPDNDLLDIWFEVHNAFPEDNSTFRKSGLRRAHALTLRLVQRNINCFFCNKFLLIWNRVEIIVIIIITKYTTSNNNFKLFSVYKLLW